LGHFIERAESALQGRQYIHSGAFQIIAIAWYRITTKNHPHKDAAGILEGDKLHLSWPGHLRATVQTKPGTVATTTSASEGR